MSVPKIIAQIAPKKITEYYLQAISFNVICMNVMQQYLLH